MGIRYAIQVWLLYWIFFILISAKACNCVSLTSTYCKADSCNQSPDWTESGISPVFSCLPCSQISLLSSLLEKHATDYNKNFQALAREFGSRDSCGKLLHNASNVFSLLVMKWNLVGEGSHRRLVSSLRFDMHSDGFYWFNTYLCEAVLMESLPTGVFADSFELQHLVHHGVILDAAVFGDVNLELPSALSNRSMVKLHLNIGQGSLVELQEGLQITNDLPLHARYPPLNASGFVEVEINPPEVIMVCKPKVLPDDCFAVLIGWNAGSAAQKVIWNVPSGNESLSGIISTVTFATALVSAFIIVYTATFCSLSSKDAID